MIQEAAGVDHVQAGATQPSPAGAAAAGSGVAFTLASTIGAIPVGVHGRRPACTGYCSSGAVFDSRSDIPMLQSEPTLIPYGLLVADATRSSGNLNLDDLIAGLEDAWLSAYTAMCAHEPNVLEFTDQGFTFLFDQTSASGADADDRLVAGYGHSTPQRQRRDASRIRGFLGGGIEIPGRGVFDKGHIFAHTMGGGLDVNLFPQRPELNRGRSAAGKTYRRMEIYAARHPGTFVFSRLLYTDETWVHL